ncbi:MAG: 2-oxoacid:acceptor oxidoreductase subunit alpha [bacterium]|nr:2-oxoacid:acceptor oxidoreductase subunit alpha [bacterium]
MTIVTDKPQADSEFIDEIIPNEDKEVKTNVVIRFAGDSGDGMQIVGELFSDTSALAGNNLNTFPDFPSEIRAPAGSLPGVSGFQINLGSVDIYTHGDRPDVLVAMNPAALKVNIPELKTGGLLIVNTGAFTETNIKKAFYDSSPLDDPKLSEDYVLVAVDLNELTKEALKDSPLKTAEKLRCKNFFALGIAYWAYSRSIDNTLEWINNKWKKKPAVAEANSAVVKAGYYLGEAAEIFIPQYEIKKAVKENGYYRKVNGNEAIAIGLIAASENCWRDIVLGSYPITPATSILETLAKHKNFNVKTVQAEDEIAAIGVAIGASYAGSLGVTTTSGPGLCLKSEALGLAVIAELPLIVVNVMRAGPSTGLPTKTEQGDLLQALYGRNGESPVTVLAASSPADCFDTALEAVRIAIKYRTPVLILSDSYIANGSEPWRIPGVGDLPDLSVEPIKYGEEYIPYERDSETLARRLAIPGRPGFEHRIGGLEKDESGTVTYDADNHDKMVRIRAEKIERIAESYEPLLVNGPESGKLLVLGWGSTYGSITSAVNNLRNEGESVSSLHLRSLNPLPLDLGDILRNFDQVLVPEINLGQLAMILRSKYLLDIKSFNKVHGKNFTISDITEKIREML